jgi:hypothetical protein
MIRPMRPGRALLYGTLVVGALDVLEVMVFAGVRGVHPARVLQGIASGLLGRGAYGGGARAAALGLLLQFFIAFVVVAVYQFASRRLSVLVRAPLPCGALYGVLVYAVMYGIVVPASAAVIGKANAAGVINGVLIHALGVGIPSALFARAAHLFRRKGDQAAPRP